MRGEHRASPARIPPSLGLPPHARGTLCLIPLLRSTSRSTPACAGNTESRSSSTDWKWVYPRMRGEHAWVSRVADTADGLPPHARGTLLIIVGTVGAVGSTPACAGNTRSRWPMVSRRKVCPRMRGEHFHTCSQRSHEIGLPPHARGTRISTTEALQIVRSTPACAGNTQKISLSAGEVYGLPPHARGTQHTEGPGVDVIGSTPACAGNTLPIIPFVASTYGGCPSLRVDSAGIQVDTRSPSISVIRRRGSPRIR